jgi:hypothetical protein
MVPENKQNRRYKQINFIGLQNNRHPSQHCWQRSQSFWKLSTKASLGIDRITAVTRSWIAATRDRHLSLSWARSIQSMPHPTSWRSILILSSLPSGSFPQVSPPKSWVRIPPGAWMFVCCVLSGRGLCDELITHPEESYRLWRVVVWSRNLVNKEAIARAGLQSQRNSNSSLSLNRLTFNYRNNCNEHTADHAQQRCEWKATDQL